jgi:RimJ/RimL family protein N-acetyltransferase
VRPSTWETPAISTDRLILTPLAIEDAPEMVAVLAGDALYEFIGGTAPSVEELRARYTRQLAGPDDRDTVWLNWIVRLRSDQTAVGAVQATVMTRTQPRTADVAWVTGLAHQGRGIASEAAVALVRWLRSAGVVTIVAAIHPDSHSSAAVARRAGLQRTEELLDGETIWRSGPS